jgi:spartin
VLSYGVTFAESGQERQLRELDSLLEQYSNFSAPQLVHGVQQQIVPEGVVSSEGKQVTEGNQAEFWKTMAPNVEDYNSRLAKGMAKGTGSLIQGIFWVRDSTLARLGNGSLYVKGKVKPNSKPSSISPQTLRNLKRVENMSIATEQVAKNVLEGVVKTVGFFSGAVMKSKPGKKFFKLLPGEVALVSMDAFAKVFDALEKAGTDVMQSTAMFTQDVVAHRYGEDAGQVTENTLSTAGHVFATAWTVSKVRRALNPSKFRPTKTGLVKAAAKAAIGGRSK